MLPIGVGPVGSCPGRDPRRCAGRCTSSEDSSHLRSPDHAYYAALKERHDGKIAAISVARKLARRCYHVLRNLDPEQVYAIPD